MAVAATSGLWAINYWSTQGLSDLSEVDFSISPEVSAQRAGSIADIVGGYETANPAPGASFAVRATADFTLDAADRMIFNLAAAGHGELYVDGALVASVRADENAGAQPGPCPSNGATVCLCSATNAYQQDGAVIDLDAGTHSVEFRYLDHPAAEGMVLDWSLGELGRRPMDLEPIEPPSVTDTDGGGEWGGVEDWPIIAIHAILTADHQLLTFGTREDGTQGGEVVYDVWDFKTDTHHTLANTTETDLFCSVPALLPTTGQILISGGDDRPNGRVSQGVRDVNIFDPDDRSLTPDALGEMAYPRWYPTAVTLSDGSIVLMGGRDTDAEGVGTPEIYTVGEGFRILDGAYSEVIAREWWYPRAFPMADGRIVIVTGGEDRSATAGPGGSVFIMDASGNGSIEALGQTPFVHVANLPAIMYAEDKVLLMADDGTLWSMDIASGVPVYDEVGDLGGPRYWANMLILPTGEVLITGGSPTRNSGKFAFKNAVRWDPADHSLTVGDGEALARLYHSSSILLPDGTVLSMGGGAPGPLVNTNVELYRPAYLFDKNGDPAERPIILQAPTFVEQGDSFEIVVDDPANVVRITMVKHGSVTHSVAMETRFHEPAYQVRSDGRITVDPTDDADVLTPGAWMVFVIDANGTPSHASSLNLGVDFAAFDTLLVNGSFEDVADGTVRAWGIDKATVDGWTEANGYTFQLSKAGGHSAGVTDGTYALDSTSGTGQAMDISQRVEGLAAGAIYRLSFDFGDRQSSLANALAVYFGGELIATVQASAPNTMETKVLYVEGDAGDGSNVLRFVEVGDSGARGMSLDNVRFVDALRGEVADDGTVPGQMIEGANGVADTLIGGPGNDTLQGFGGIDSHFGNGGNDTVDISHSLAKATVDLARGLITFPNATEIIDSIESVIATQGENRIIGTDGNNTVDGQGGSDTMVYSGAETDYTVTETTGVTTVQGPGGEVDTLISVEFLVFLGDASGELIQGSDKVNDTLVGGPGDDTLKGGTGIDSHFGNGGNDTVDISHSSAKVTVDLAGGLITFPNATEIIDSIESVIATQGNNTIYGTAGDNVIDGQAGTDTYVLAQVHAAYTIDTSAADGSVTISGPEGEDTLFNVEFLHFSDVDVLLG